MFRRPISLALPSLVPAVLCLTALTIGPCPAEPMKAPAAEYLKPAILDEFNPDVTDAQRAAEPAGRAGGRLRIRTPTEYAELNAITSTGQPERVVISHMTDSLVDQDTETLEYFPEMAWSWRETDQIRRKGAAPEDGRILEVREDSIVFVPGAWIQTFGRFDVAGIEGNTVTLTEQRGATTHTGRIAEGRHTVRVDEGLDSPKAANAQTIPLAELETYEYRLGPIVEPRPWAKRDVVFELFIRPGVTWSDGTPFTGEDVLFSYQTIMNPGVEAQHMRNFFMDVAECTVHDEGRTVRFVYAKTYFAALDFLGGINGQSYFIPRHIFRPEQYGGDEKAFADAFNRSPFRERPVYTGPYKLKEWKRKDRLTLVRDESYWKNQLPEGAVPRWRKGQPYMDEISFILYTEAAASVKDLQRGALDADLDVEPQTWVQADVNSPAFLARMTRAQRVGFLYTYIGWNMNNPLFRDPNVRRALAMLIPRQDIAKNVHYDVAFPVTGPFYVNGPGYDKSVEVIPHDPAGARRLLARAGWLDRDGDGVLEKEIDGKMVPFRFSYSIHTAREYHQKIADIVKESVEQAGIQMTINKSEWANYIKQVREKNFDSVRFAWGTSIEPDPFQIWHSSQMENGGDNFISYKNDRVDELCVKIREELDAEKRWEMAREIHRIVAAEQPYCFLFGFYETYFISRGLRGVRLYPSMYPHDFTEWYWEKTPEGRE